MKFIFPQNYNFTAKLLGFIDYTTVILNIIWGILIFSLMYFCFLNVTLKICIFIILFLPFSLLSIVGFNHEKILYIIEYIFIYIYRPKIYLYKKY